MSMRGRLFQRPKSLSADGRTARAYRLDVSSAEQVADVFASVTRDLGLPDALVNNAGIIRVIPFSTCLKPHGIAFSTPEGRLPLQPGVRSHAARTGWRRQCRVDGGFLGQSRRRILQRVESRACDVHEIVGAGTRPFREFGSMRSRPV